MWTWAVLMRVPRGDAGYWPGRRVLGVVDALAWPALWIAWIVQWPGRGGVFGTTLMALCVCAAVGRVWRAGWRNHRYFFTTWRWGRVLAALLAFGLALKAVVLVSAAA